MQPDLATAVDLKRIGAYRGLEEIERALAALGELHVDGRSHEGRPLWRLEVGDRDAPAVSLVIAGLHAMEWIGVETALAIARDFGERAPQRRLVMHPVANPDGYARAERHLRAGQRRFTRVNARGVDLNRNYPTHFRAFHLRAVLLPFLGGPGATPGSEPETAAVLATLARESGRIDRAVSLHSFGDKILLPYGGRWAPPTDIERLRVLGHEVNARLPRRYDVRVTSRWGPGFFAHGMELDHLHEQGAAALLIECSRGGWALRDPSSWVHPFRWYNPPDPASEAGAITAALRPFLDPGAGRAA